MSKEDPLDQLLAEIEEKIEEINNHKIMRAAEKLIDRRTKLIAARRALLGGNALTGGSSGTRITRDDVIRSMDATGPNSVAALAQKLSTSEAVIRGHLSRGKDEAFIKKGSDWYLRDPERGINTEHDIEEDDGED